MNKSYQHTTAKAQVSLEYLLVLASFFAALVFFLPAVEYASDKLFASNDILAAKNIVATLKEECALFQVLGDGSLKTFEFGEVHNMNISSKNNVLTVKVQGNQFQFDCISEPFSLSPQKEFTLVIKKQQSKVFFLVK